jgi:hypothetical protein
MQKQRFLAQLEPRFRMPEGYQIGYYRPNQRGRVRYGIRHFHRWLSSQHRNGF